MLLVAGSAAGILALGVTLSSAVSANQSSIAANRSSIAAACAQVHKLETVIHAVLAQSLRTFGQKGTSGYAYYRAHPAELAAGRAALRREIAEFANTRC